MPISNEQLLLRRSINVKAIVTPRWKEEAQQQLQTQLNQTDAQLQQLEVQAQQIMAEIQKQSLQIVGAQGLQPTDNIQAQLNDVQVQVNNQRSELLEQKNQVLQQLQQVQLLELNQEVSQGQIDSFFQVQQGDNLIQKMQVELLLRDGVIEEIRGSL
ncbi:MAG TPA: YlqD family protein [Candidatus Caenarcaniphilales bacterium]